MLQISHKQTHIKGIRTKNPINAKCVQLIELHAFACCLLLLFLAALLGSRRVTIVAQQCKASLPLPSLLGYFTSQQIRKIALKVHKIYHIPLNLSTSSLESPDDAVVLIFRKA